MCTPHAVFGGAGFQGRWYDINPATHTLIQHGTLTSSSSFTFDGAISPDRLVNGTTRKYGGGMVIHVVPSPTTTPPPIHGASQIRANPPSPPQTLPTPPPPPTRLRRIQAGGP